MLTWDDVARACLALPGTTEAVSARGRRRWLVRGRTFVRDRPLHRTDLAELGDAAPQGPILVAYVPDTGVEGGPDRRGARRLLHDVALRRASPSSSAGWTRSTRRG